jgi:hypothetical protein
MKTHTGPDSETVIIETVIQLTNDMKEEFGVKETGFSPNPFDPTILYSVAKNTPRLSLLLDHIAIREKLMVGKTMNTPMKHEYASTLGYMAVNVEDLDFTRSELDSIIHAAENLARRSKKARSKISECAEPVKNVNYEQLRNMGVQNHNRAAPPRDHTFDSEGRTCTYYASFKPDMSKLARDRLDELGYSCTVCTTMPDDGYEHLYTARMVDDE